MARKPWLSKQRPAIQKAYKEALKNYSPRTALAKVKDIATAPASHFVVLKGSRGLKAILKGDRSLHPITISERQLRIKRAGGLTQEALAKGVERPLATYKNETTRIAGQRQSKRMLSGKLGEQSVVERMREAGDRVNELVNHHGQSYRATEKGRAAYETNRERWLAGEYLDPRDYSNLRDYAIAAGDPITKVLKASPKTRPAVIAAAAAA